MLALLLNSYSRVFLRKVVQEQHARVDGEVVKPSFRVRVGQQIEVDLPPPPVDGPVPEDIPLNVIFEDESLLAIDKPPGMVVHPAKGHWSGTLASALAHRFQQLSDVGGPTRPGIVHRLDRDTSGVMVFGRTPHAKRALAAQFFEHSVERVYQAIAYGVVPAARMDTHLLLDRGDAMRGSHGHHQREHAAPPADAKRAITFIEPIAALAGATLVECRLETGRQHQIRIHLAELGHPVVGERVYIRDYRGERIEAPRPMLHARTLGFEHPRTRALVHFEREPPDDFRAMIEALRLPTETNQ